MWWSKSGFGAFENSIYMCCCAYALRSFQSEDLLHVLHQGVACCAIPALVIECIVLCCGDGMTLNDLQRKLQGDVWKHYKAWCRENAVAACGHRFSLIRFGKEAWNRAPELASCYKAFTVKQMIYWVHAYLMDTMPHSQHDLTRASYSMAKMQFNMDVSGPFFQEDIKADTVLMGRSFLLFYQRLAVQNTGFDRQNFKIIPKHHAFLHLILYVQRTARNPRKFGSDFADISDWFVNIVKFLLPSPKP